MVKECAGCGVTPHDLPFEEVGLDADEAADLLFETAAGRTWCQGCAPEEAPDDHR